MSRPTWADPRPRADAPKTGRNSFDVVAPVYDWIASIGTLGAVGRSKSTQTRFMSSGESVLYAGVGTGADAAQAASVGADVTVVDLSAKMIDRARARFERSELESVPSLICGDIMAHGTSGQYDVVVANYFLNVFEASAMRDILAHLTNLVRPGGKLLIADFTGPRGGGFAQWMQAAHHNFVVGLFKVLAGGDLHPLHDPAAALAELGWKVDEEKTWGPCGYYCSIVASRLTNE